MNSSIPVTHDTLGQPELTQTATPPPPDSPEAEAPATNPIVEEILNRFRFDAPNPAKSGATGPRTPEGKAVSSQNARKDGFTARAIPIAPHEQEAFARQIHRFLTEFQPAGEYEAAVFNEMMIAHFQLRKVRTRQGEIAAQIDPYDIDLPEDHPLVRKFNALERHATRFTRTFDRCYRELRTAATNRIVLQTLPDELRESGECHVDAARLAARAVLQKRTSSDPYVKQLQDLIEADEAQIAAVTARVKAQFAAGLAQNRH